MTIWSSLRLTVIIYSVNNRQKEELAKYYLNVSLLALGSLVFSSIGQSDIEVKIALAIYGLTVSIVFLILGMYLFKEVR